MAQFVLGIFLRDDSRLAFCGSLRVKFADIVFIRFDPTGVYQLPVAPLYAALVLFIARYYLFPLIIGFDVESFSQMPLEKLLLSAKADLGL